MRIIKIKGGLGNQMFQYAFARYFGIERRIDVKLDNGINTNKQDTVRQYSLDNFNTILPLASKEEVLKAKYPYGIVSKIKRGFKSKILRIHNIGYVTNILNTKENYLEGFWQSYKYLEPIRDILLKEITPRNPSDERFDNIIKQIENTPSISIHIRRGDYVTDPKTKAVHNVCGLEYYLKAIDTIKAQVNNPTFFVFSDDIDWVSKNLEINSPTFWVSNLRGEDYEELILMSKCKHNIIANSSFSFWGAWLNQNTNKIVIAPKKWNNKYQKEYEDLLPPLWIKI